MRSMGWLRSDRLASVGVVFTSSLRIDLQVVPDTCTSCSVLLGYMSALDVVRVSVPQYTLLTVHPAFVQHTKHPGGLYTLYSGPQSSFKCTAII